MKQDQRWSVVIDDYLGFLVADGCLDSTIETRRQQLQYVARRVGGDPLTVTGPPLRAWFQGMRQTVKADTARGRRAALRGFYRWAVDQGRMPGPSPALAIPRVQPSPPRPRPVADEVWAAAWAAASELERVALDLAGNHGLRRCEIAVVWPDLDMFPDLGGWSLVVHGKGGKERYVPLTDGCARRLRALGPGWAFPGAVDGHLSPRWLGTRINRLLPQGWTIHKLRHRAGSRWRKESGGDMRLVAELLGHGDTKTTMIYTAVGDEETRALVNRAAA